MVIKAFELSERFDTPVMLRLTTRISHSKCAVELGEVREPLPAKYQRNIAKYTMMPNFARLRHTIVEQRMLKLREFSEDCEFNIIEEGDYQVSFITGGISYQYVKELRPKSAIFKIGTSYPLPIEKIRKFARKCARLIVVEELEPFYEEQLKIAGIPCEGKDFFSLEGELNLERMRKGLISAGIMQDGKALPQGENIIPRPPVLCPGCAHRGVFVALKKLKAEVFGDIGCYTLAGFEPLEAIHFCVCMGASIGGAIGASLVKGTDKPVAIIGDSTFLHSGITGLLDAVYNQATVTVVILDNRATAMTGGQQHPATGYNLKGEPAPAVDLEQLVRALGVKNVRLVDPYNLEETAKTLKQSMAEAGPSVVITTRPCMLFPKRLTGQAYYITEECNGCSACLKIGCPALSGAGTFTAKGLEKVKIDETTCTGCKLCVQVCPINVIFPLENVAVS
jgi:indolepyruvate ferredoxin oxidoreductase alpha subunit